MFTSADGHLIDLKSSERPVQPLRKRNPLKCSHNHSPNSLHHHINHIVHSKPLLHLVLSLPRFHLACIIRTTMCYHHPLTRFRTHLHHGLLCQKILTHIYSSRCRWYSARNLLRVPVHLTVGHSINKHDQTPLLTHPLSFPPQQHHVLEAASRWHPWMSPYGYEVILLPNMVKKCYGCGSKFVGKYRNSRFNLVIKHMDRRIAGKDSLGQSRYSVDFNNTFFF